MQGVCQDACSFEKRSVRVSGHRKWADVRNEWLYLQTTARPAPGDYFVLSHRWVVFHFGRFHLVLPDLLGLLIMMFTRSIYNHAGIMDTPDPDGTQYVLEANRHGFRRAPLSEYAGCKQIKWSHDPLTLQQRHTILREGHARIGTPYGWLDYVAIILHRLGIRVPAVVNRVLSEDRLICSQAVALLGELAGETQWLCGETSPQFVIPGELAQRLV